MKEIEVRYGVIVDIDSNGPGIYIAVPIIEDAMEIIRNTEEIYEETICNVLKILETAQKCNAGLREIRSNRQEGKISISFEFEFWENFLEFKKRIEELSL